MYKSKVKLKIKLNSKYNNIRKMDTFWINDPKIIIKDYYENELDKDFTNYIVGKFSGDNAENKIEYFSSLLKIEFGEENVSVENNTIKLKRKY